MKQSEKDIGEKPKLRTEPDIIVVTDEELVFIEVKVKSGMPKNNWSKFKKYYKDNEKYYNDFKSIRKGYTDKKILFMN